MLLEFIKNKVYYKIFDLSYKVSTGIYNKHKYEDAAKLAEIQQNVDNIKSEYNAKELVILNQVHGNQVICADNIDYQDQLEADGSVTSKKSIILSIMSADCVPVLFASSDGSVIGAAHCGWRSAKKNLIYSINSMMKNNNANSIKAIIGPSIAQESYEVSSEYYNEFISDDVSCKNLFIPSENKKKYMFNLVGYVKQKIKKENIELLFHINHNTYKMPEKYPSYRRSAHKGGKHTQSILSTIMIRS